MPREYFPGIGQAVADRTINRGGEGWGDVADRVSLGNSLLHPTGAKDQEPLRHAIAKAQLLMSGRHLQHGDIDQPGRNLEVFTNCSTASQRTMLFYLLLNGSGVGTSYDDDMQVVDWSRMPEVRCVLSNDHADNDGLTYLTREEAITECQHFQVPYDVFIVPDSREGWAEAVQVLENMAFDGGDQHSVIILDFSNVRPKGSPIGGMQNRPSSGPVPLMGALEKLNEVRGGRMPLWMQALWIDHQLAEVVLVGGARRAARIAVKWWEDTDILDFIKVKQEAGLWSANNSIGVDARFWDLVKFVKEYDYCPTGAHKKARDVFDAAVDAQYNHGTGEPGFLNMDLISQGEVHEPGQALGGLMNLTAETHQLRKILCDRAGKKKYPVIVNPCGEIRISVNGGYCVIADIAAVFCDDLADVARLTTRALIRTNLMPALYSGEVTSTNRIGVGLTGIHEMAWQQFGLTFYDLIAEGEGTMLDANGLEMAVPKHRKFWDTIYGAAIAVEEECESYCRELGVPMPRTRRTIKPSGSVSKLFGLTEGAHLASLGEYLRWVQFSHGDPLIERYEEQGYPVIRELKTYNRTSIVGFPTKLPIVEMMGPNLITAAQATPVEQVRWLRLLETFWLLAEGGNQVSYTLKYDPKVVSEQEYKDFILEHVPTVRAVSIMPQIDATAYEYQPEEPVTPERFAEIEARIRRTTAEEVGREHIGCASGACPVDFSERTDDLSLELETVGA